MSLSTHHNHHTHHFLQNKEMNEMYIFYAISNFAYGLMSVFVPIYLYKAGFSVISIMLFYLIVPTAFVVFSMAGAKIVSHFGAKHAMAIATPMTIAFLLGLRVVDDYQWLFYVLPVIYGVKAVIFNYGFHLNFVEHSDKKHRGKQVTMIQASAMTAGLLSPFFGGLIVGYFGFNSLFVAGSIVYAVSIIPLLLHQDIHEKIDFNAKDVVGGLLAEKNRPLLWSFSGYAVEEWIGYVIWPLFLFVFFLNAEKIGLAVSLTAVLTFAAYYFVGRATDRNDKKKLIKIGTILYFFGWMGRLLVNSFTSAVFVDTYKSISANILHIPWTAYSYDLAGRRDYFKFIVQRELVFDLSRMAVVPFLILLFAVGYHPYAVSFVVAALVSLLYASLNRVELEKEVEPQYEE